MFVESLQNGQIVWTTKFSSLFQEKQYFGIKPKRKFNFQYTIRKSTLWATKIIALRDLLISLSR